MSSKTLGGVSVATSPTAGAPDASRRFSRGASLARLSASADAAHPAAERLQRLQRLRVQVTALRQRVEGLRLAKELDIDWERDGVDSGGADFAFGIRRQLRGHFGKVYDADWAGDDSTAASVAQDGRLIVWNAFTEAKRDVVTLPSAWVLAVAFEKAASNLVASGGLDSVATVTSLRSRGITPPVVLAGHRAYITDAAFAGEGRLFTASGDHSAGAWDVATGARVASFEGHEGDVMALALHPLDPRLLATASCDTTVRVWDERAPRVSVRAFYGHAADANAVDFMASGNAVGTGSDDATCRVFDLRSCGAVNVFGDARVRCGITDVAFSLSGRLLFAACEEPLLLGWETIARDGAFHELRGHRGRLSTVSVNLAGEALLTGSWDRELAVWA